MRYGFLSILFVLCAGCSVLSPVGTTPMTNYEISSVPSVRHQPMRQGDLLVMAMQSDPLYSSSQMAYRLSPYQLHYYARNRWLESPATMLQPLLVQTLQQTHAFHSVDSLPSMAHHNYLLSTRLVRLEQVFLQDSSHVVLSVQAQIVDVGSGRILASKEFTVSEEASMNACGDAVATNKAAERVLRQIAQFCTRHI